jgi:tripartite-type tricarboxylate transporter receptor subunit TctC
MKRLLSGFFALGIMFSTILTAVAQESGAYPTRPVTLVVQATAGGGNDAIARIFARQMQVSLGQPIIVENRAGGGGAVGSAYVAKSTADGYTLLLLTTGETYYKAMNPTVRFDTVKDFSPIAMVASIPLVLVTNESAPFSSLAELIAFAKAHPKELTYGSAGIGSPHHLAGEMLNMAAGVEITHVPYRGTAPAITDLLGKQISLAWSSPAAVKAFVDAKKLNALAVVNSSRAEAFPQLPTIAESGYPDVKVDLWFGIVAPQGTPAAIVQRIYKAIRDSGADVELRQNVTNIGFQLTIEGPAEFAARIAADSARYTTAIKAMGLAKE